MSAGGLIPEFRDIAHLPAAEQNAERDISRTIVICHFGYISRRVHSFAGAGAVIRLAEPPFRHVNKRRGIGGINIRLYAELGIALGKNPVYARLHDCEIVGKNALCGKAAELICVADVFAPVDACAVRIGIDILG
ncbi:unknown [Candidatus Apopatosoma intestinale]|nr:unknown [Candidatus Apopatosoma intestinale]